MGVNQEEGELKKWRAVEAREIQRPIVEEEIRKDRRREIYEIHRHGVEAKTEEDISNMNNVDVT